MRPPCTVEGCGRPNDARGLCRMHYKRWKKHGDPLVTIRVPQGETCTVDGCETRPVAHGLCQTHLARRNRHGSTDLPERPTVLERFWAKVNKDGPSAPISWDGAPLPGMCWLWEGAADAIGYGKFNPGARLIGAHRYSYQSMVGAIPAGLYLDHLCRNPRCVNPDHLEPVTHAENVRRGAIARKRMNR